MYLINILEIFFEIILTITTIIHNISGNIGYLIYVLYNKIYLLCSSFFNQETKISNDNTIKSEPDEAKEKINQIPIIANYKYNPGKHLRIFISNFSDTVKNKKTEIKFDFCEDDIKKIEEQLNKIDNPTVKDLSNILFSQGCRYQRHIKIFMEKLNYKIPIITNAQINIIIKHFLINKKKFSVCKTGHAPYRNFFDICTETIKELELPINLNLQKN